jgi:transcriptional regulator with XRE-family HTH domain
MNIRDIRLARLNILLQQHKGSKAALARTLKKAPAQVSQWCNGVRTISEDSAREIEAATKRPAGWMDEPVYPPAQLLTRGTAREEGTSMVLSASEYEIILRIREIGKR